MTQENEILNKLNEIEDKLEKIQSEIEEINKGRKLRERPLNFWEFILEVDWSTIFIFLVGIIFMLKKI